MFVTYKISHKKNENNTIWMIEKKSCDHDRILNNPRKEQSSRKYRAAHSLNFQEQRGGLEVRLGPAAAEADLAERRGRAAPGRGSERLLLADQGSPAPGSADETALLGQEQSLRRGAEHQAALPDRVRRPEHQ